MAMILRSWAVLKRMPSVKRILGHELAQALQQYLNAAFLDLILKGSNRITKMVPGLNHLIIVSAKTW